MRLCVNACVNTCVHASVHARCFHRFYVLIQHERHDDMSLTKQHFLLLLPCSRPVRILSIQSWKEQARQQFIHRRPQKIYKKIKMHTLIAQDTSAILKLPLRILRCQSCLVSRPLPIVRSNLVAGHLRLCDTILLRKRTLWDTKQFARQQF